MNHFVSVLVDMFNGNVERFSQQSEPVRIVDCVDGSDKGFHDPRTIEAVWKQASFDVADTFCYYDDFTLTCTCCKDSITITATVMFDYFSPTVRCKDCTNHSSECAL